MDWLWTWSGVSFGYRHSGDLYTGDGRHVGHFEGDDVFSRDGDYLGEVRDGERLITQHSKLSRRASARARKANRVPSAAHVAHVGKVMVVSCEDFPAPTAL